MKPERERENGFEAPKAVPMPLAVLAGEQSHIAPFYRVAWQPEKQHTFGALANVNTVSQLIDIHTFG